MNKVTTLLLLSILVVSFAKDSTSRFRRSMFIGHSCSHRPTRSKEECEKRTHGLFVKKPCHFCGKVKLEDGDTGKKFDFRSFEHLIDDLIPEREEKGEYGMPMKSQEIRKVYRKLAPVLNACVANKENCVYDDDVAEIMSWHEMMALENPHTLDSLNDGYIDQ